MNCDAIETLLDDLEGAPGTDPRRGELEQHLEGCPRCRARSARRAALAGAVARLPREVAPARDLWPEVRARIEAPAVPPARRGWAPAAQWGALAASLLLAALALVVALRSRTDPGPGAASAAVEVPAQASPAALEASADPLLEAQHNYAAAADALLAAIGEHRGQLSPETIETLEHNLALIDGAIAEIQASLHDAPQQPGREKMLATLYKKKIDLLWRVSRLSS